MIVTTLQLGVTIKLGDATETGYHSGRLPLYLQPIAHERICPHKEWTEQKYRLVESASLVEVDYGND